MAIEAEAAERPRVWTEDEVARIAAARAIWNEGRDPRGTLAEHHLIERGEPQTMRAVIAAHSREEQDDHTL